MLRSMTGFGAVTGKVDGVEYTVEVRSVNNRYFKVSIKLPEGLGAVEPAIETMLRDGLNRGSVTVTLRMRLPAEQAAGHVNVAALNRYLEQLKAFEIDANPTLRIDLAALLQLPGVCESPPLEEMLRRTQDGLLSLVGEALARAIEMRCREGQALQVDLLENCDLIEKNVAEVAKRAPDVVADYQRRLAGRVTELTHAGNVQIDQDQLAREVAIFAERCDIAEETSRLTGHLEQFRKAVTLDGPIGRKLDFIAQEMLREANTIASKANDAEIGQAAVEMKTAIDRIKEQVQNAE